MQQVGLLKILRKRCNNKGVLFPQLTNPITLATKRVCTSFWTCSSLLGHQSHTCARTAFKPRFGLHFQSTMHVKKLLGIVLYTARKCDEVAKHNFKHLSEIVSQVEDCITRL
jgi:hypothetical protein